MARASGVVVATVVLIRLSIILGFVSFVLGLVGFTVAAVGVRTGSVTRVDLPVFPFQIGTAIDRREEVEAQLQKRSSSKLSLEL